MRQHRERLIVACPLVAHVRRQAPDGLQIVREDVGPCVDDDVDRGEIAAVIAAENLDSSSGHALVNRAHGIGEDQCAAVGEIVAVDGRHDEILPAQIAHGFGHAQRFEPVDLSARITGLDVAETAAARAEIAQDHDRRRSRAPAFRHIRTGRLFADRMQRERIDPRLDALVLRPARQRNPQPRRLAASLARAVDDEDRHQINLDHATCCSSRQT